jgi:hypothetical protein
VTGADDTSKPDNWTWRLDGGRRLMRIDNDEQGGPTRVVWERAARTSTQLVDKRTRLSCRDALLADELDRRRPRVDPDDDPRILQWAEVYADDPKLRACCDRCHEQRDPFLPEDLFASSCPTCGADDPGAIFWRSLMLTPFDLTVKDEDGRRRKIRRVEINVPCCLHCWPDSGWVTPAEFDQ